MMKKIEMLSINFAHKCHIFDSLIIMGKMEKLRFRDMVLKMIIKNFWKLSRYKIFFKINLLIFQFWSLQTLSLKLQTGLRITW